MENNWGNITINGGNVTFARNNVDTYNCYYTYLLNDSTNYVPMLVDGTVIPAKWHNGTVALSITAGDYVTVNHAGDTAYYTTSGITAYKATGANGNSDPFIAGLKYNNVLYAGQGDAVVFSRVGQP